MGIVTVLVTSNCPFCDVVLGELDEALKSIGDDASNVRIQTLDISRSAALAKQCAQLSQTTSVPQVFFNAKHIGGAQIVRRLRERGELRPLLEDLARQPAIDFPPPTDAIMVKATEETAFSGQPTLAQIDALGRYGFRSVLCLKEEWETATIVRSERESCARQGVEYVQHALVLDRRAVHEVAQSVMDAVRLLERMPKPCLVHCSDGLRAGLVVLLHAAHRLKAPAASVLQWAQDLRQGFDREPALKAVVESACEQWTAGAAPAVDPAPASSTSKVAAAAAPTATSASSVPAAATGSIATEGAR